MEITKNNLKQFRSEFKSTVKDLEKKFGVAIEMGNIRFGMSDFSTKLTVTSIGKIDDGKSKTQAKFEAQASRFGFNKNDYNKTVKLQGKNYLFVGFKKGARKNTCMIESPQGTVYVTDANTVRQNMV